MAINLANNSSLANITALPSSISGGGMTLISEQTASSSATIDFTSGIDSTYDSYVFKFYNMHPATDNVDFTFNGSIDGGSNYNVVKTTIFFRATHNEAGNDSGLEYRASQDLAQSTAAQIILQQIGNDNDQSGSGTLTLYNPSSTTFVKHFIVRVNTTTHNDQCISDHIAGYFNNTNDINAVQFKMSSGNFDGVIKLYGVS